MLTAVALISPSAWSAEIQFAPWWGMIAPLYGVNRCTEQRLNGLVDTRGYGQWSDKSPTIRFSFATNSDAREQGVDAVQQLVAVLKTSVGVVGLPPRDVSSVVGGADDAMLLRMTDPTSPLLPDRCQWKNPNNTQPHRLTLGEIWKSCEDKYPPDQIQLRNRPRAPGALSGGWIEVAASESLSLTEYLQRFSDKLNLVWRYECMEAIDPDFGTNPVCVFEVARTETWHKYGAMFLRMSVRDSGPTGCAAFSP